MDQESFNETNTSGGEPIVLPPPRFRTVMDCEDEISLRWALMEHPPGTTPTSGSCPIDSAVLNDWQTPHLDLNTSCPQNLNDEVKRLMTLKEYSILDSDHEEKFERITALASRIFDAPICLVSLVDIGRQWFMSNRGLGDVRETSRQVSFCAHAIQSKDEDIFIIPETHADERFVNNGLVRGAPFIRFYAGVPLVAPEGHKLGTFCVIDTKPRPNGLSLNEKQNLRELAAMTIDTMVNRKQELQRIQDEKIRLMACAAHDLMSPLTGIQLNLGLLIEDDSFVNKLDSHHQDLIKSSLRCSEIIERICKTAIESFRGENTEGLDSEKGVVTISDLVKNVDKVVGMYPKNVPVFINVDENVPTSIVSDDLKLFRSILNYLTNACKHTQNGSIHLRIFKREAAIASSSDIDPEVSGTLMAPITDVLVVECEDTGPGVPLEKLSTLFTPLKDLESRDIRHEKAHDSGLGLYSVATEISSLGGNWGVYSREATTGSVFWFTVPLIESPMSRVDSSPMIGDQEEKLAPRKNTIENKLASTKITGESLSSLSSAESMSRTKLPLKTNMTFPIVEKSPSVHATESKKQRVCPPRQKRILIIDDSATIRKALSRGFQVLGFETDEAENGLQGYNLMTKNCYDLCMVDFLMPIMDGVDLVKKIRSWEKVSRSWYHQHIIGLSAHAHGPDAEAGLKAGMDRFMSKPIPIKTLKDLANSKAVIDAGRLLDSMFETKYNEMEEGFSKCNDSNSLSNSMKSSDSLDDSKKKSCLIVLSKPDNSEHSLQRLAELNGWKSIVVFAGDDALRLLKIRRWGVVIIDNDLPSYSGVNCIARFRDWERHSSMSTQKNVYIMSDCYDPLSLPAGFDGALEKPFNPSQISNVLNTA